MVELVPGPFVGCSGPFWYYIVQCKKVIARFGDFSPTSHEREARLKNIATPLRLTLKLKRSLREPIVKLALFDIDLDRMGTNWIRLET